MARTGSVYSGWHFDTLWDVVLHVEEQRGKASQNLESAKRSLKFGERGKRRHEDNVLQYTTAYKIWDDVWSWLTEMVEREEKEKFFQEQVVPMWEKGIF